MSAGWGRPDGLGNGTRVMGTPDWQETMTQGRVPPWVRMSAVELAERSPRSGPPDEWKRRVTTLLVRLERVIVELRQATDGLADRAQLKCYAWRAALDPEGREWGVQARKDVANGTARERALGRDDLRRLLEERRSTH